MITVFIIAGILIVFVVGFIDVYKRHSRIVAKIYFAGEYLNKFIFITPKSVGSNPSPAIFFYQQVSYAPSQAHLQGTQSQHTKANPDSYRDKRACLVYYLRSNNTI